MTKRRHNSKHSSPLGHWMMGPEAMPTPQSLSLSSVRTIVNLESHVPVPILLFAVTSMSTNSLASLNPSFFDHKMKIITLPFLIFVLTMDTVWEVKCDFIYNWKILFNKQLVYIILPPRHQEEVKLQSVSGNQMVHFLQPCRKAEGEALGFSHCASSSLPIFFHPNSCPIPSFLSLQHAGGESLQDQE